AAPAADPDRDAAHRICAVCGAANDLDARFCKRCGARMEAPA
ncbi:MAG: zinc ribbon domain-containing protein, partial [Acidobacteria bacterium]|nr:zinc ribbon domain-containing protein [Acidobacteriota bacterium]